MGGIGEMGHLKERKSVSWASKACFCSSTYLISPSLGLSCWCRFNQKNPGSSLWNALLKVVCLKIIPQKDGFNADKIRPLWAHWYCNFEFPKEGWFNQWQTWWNSSDRPSLLEAGGPKGKGGQCARVHGEHRGSEINHGWSISPISVHLLKYAMTFLRFWTQFWPTIV